MSINLEYDEDTFILECTDCVDMIETIDAHEQRHHLRLFIWDCDSEKNTGEKPQWFYQCPACKTKCYEKDASNSYKRFWKIPIFTPLGLDKLSQLNMVDWVLPRGKIYMSEDLELSCEEDELDLTPYLDLHMKGSWFTPHDKRGEIDDTNDEALKTGVGKIYSHYTFSRHDLKNCHPGIKGTWGQWVNHVNIYTDLNAKVTVLHLPEETHSFDLTD